MKQEVKFNNSVPSPFMTCVDCACSKKKECCKKYKKKGVHCKKCPKI